jgi:TolB-like protein
MKNLFRFLLLTLTCITNIVQAQTPKRPTITVLNIDSKGIPMDAQQLGNLSRIELEKLDTFDVTDRYDVIYLVEKNQLNIANCYGKLCLVEVGKTINTEYMFTGNVELYGNTIIVTIRLINIKTESVEKTVVNEFLNLPLEVQSMLAISIQKMFGEPVNEDLQSRLTKKFDYENAINNPNKTHLNLNGPRFGYTFIFGNHAERLQDKRSNGGYEAYPAMFQFGYQFEKQYLNEGNYQALFEFIPMITGVDQQLFIPSLTLLNGFRNNKSGWEIAIGPTLSLAHYAQVANIDGTYYTKPELQNKGLTEVETKRQLDSRGDLDVTTALVVAIGKSFKSGKMNIPVNFWATIPTSDGFRLGVSVGYNSKK